MPVFFPFSRACYTFYSPPPPSTPLPFAHLQVRFARGGGSPRFFGLAVGSITAPQDPLRAALCQARLPPFLALLATVARSVFSRRGEHPSAGLVVRQGSFVWPLSLLPLHRFFLLTVPRPRYEPYLKRFGFLSKPFFFLGGLLTPAADVRFRFGASTHVSPFVGLSGGRTPPPPPSFVPPPP